MKVYIGVDNGVSGSVGIIDNNSVQYLHTPIFRCLSYKKSKKEFSNRLNFLKFRNIIKMFNIKNMLVIFERPFVNSMMFKASISAVRCLEAQLIVMDIYKIPYMYIDSKLWQKELLPKKVEKKSDLKNVSLEVGKRLFPRIDFSTFKDADGLLIAEYARRKNL